MSLNEVMNLWGKKLGDSECTDADDLMDQDSNEEMDEGESEENSTTQLIIYRDFIFQAPAYQWLLGSLRREFLLHHAQPNCMNAIRRNILNYLPPSNKVSRKKSSETYKVTFEVEWDPLEFVKEQLYEEEPDEAIEIAITLTGSINDAQALTCTQYLHQTWPSSGYHIMKLVKDVVRAGLGIRNTCKLPTFQGDPIFGLNYFILGTLPDNTKLAAWVDDAKFMVEALGTADSIAEVGEQLGWLGAALRSSNDDHGVKFYYPSIRLGESLNTLSMIPSQAKNFGKICFSRQEQEEHTEPSNGQCWHNMFRNPVVVQGYPILRRCEWDTGLEIPLNIMAGLARTQSVNIFNRNLFIKGFSTMLTPTKRVGDLLIWHLLYNKDGSRISYLDSKLDQVNNFSMFELENTRHVLGWCSDVKYRAGKI
jgi:hypothetical protein